MQKKVFSRNNNARTKIKPKLCTTKRIDGAIMLSVSSYSNIMQRVCEDVKTKRKPALTIGQVMTSWVSLVLTLHFCTSQEQVVCKSLQYTKIDEVMHHSDEMTG